MECNKYVEEKTGETETSEFREHLAGCPGCARDIEELREVRSLYRAASTEKYRGAFPQVRRSRGAWLPLAAAAAVLVGVFSLVLSRPGDAPPTNTDTNTTSTVFVRIPLQPWGSDLRVTNALDDCWQKLESLEKMR
jgi:hypothetical protein